MCSTSILLCANLEFITFYIKESTKFYSLNTRYAIGGNIEGVRVQKALLKTGFIIYKV